MDIEIVSLNAKLSETGNDKASLIKLKEALAIFNIGINTAPNKNLDIDNR